MQIYMHLLLCIIITVQTSVYSCLNQPISHKLKSEAVVPFNRHTYMQTLNKQDELYIYTHIHI